MEVVSLVPDIPRIVWKLLYQISELAKQTKLGQNLAQGLPIGTATIALHAVLAWPVWELWSAVG